jgi:N-acetylneuraminic acid mutarotase
MHFLELPEELILTVISWLPLSGVLSVRLCCREMNRVCHDNSLWRGRFVVLGEYIAPALKEAPITELPNNAEVDLQEGQEGAEGDEQQQEDAEEQEETSANGVNAIDGEATLPPPPKFVYPSERLWCSSVVYGSSLFIYGGHTTRGSSNLISNVKADMFAYDFAMKQWSEITHDIGGKTEHKCVVYDNALWFVGGYNGHSYTNDLRRFEPSTKTSTVVEVAGRPFSPRSALTAVVHQHKMYTFGGWNGFTKQWYNDLYCFNFDTKQWREVATSGERPSHRTSHASVVWNNKMYVFAGFSGENYLNDLHEFDFATETWRDVTHETKGTRPSPRSRFCAVVHGNTMYLLGGWNKVNYFEDFFTYNFVTKTWTEITTPHFDIPSLSQYSISVHDNKLYIFGGFCSKVKECVNRLYAYQLPQDECVYDMPELEEVEKQSEKAEEMQSLLPSHPLTYITSE